MGRIEGVHNASSGTSYVDVSSAILLADIPELACFPGDVINSLEAVNTHSIAIHFHRQLPTSHLQSQMFSPYRQQSQPSKPAHHLNSTASSFRNPWPQNWPDSASLFRIPFIRAEPFERTDIKPTETVTPDWSVYEAREDGIRFTWLGHAVRGIVFDLRHDLAFTILSSTRVSSSNSPLWI